jgi:enoyl-CoA hydratase/carnithine racemase
MIAYENDGQTARITFNAPGTGNRITYGMMTDYIAALEASHQSGARVLVLRSEGEHFTLGRDQKEKVDVPKRDNLGLILRANDLLRTFPGVSLALVRGRAMGFGSGIALHASIAVAEESAIFGFDEIKHGLAPLIVVLYLPHFIPRKAASELCLTGRDVGAAEAAAIGLINRVVPDGALAAAEAEILDVLASYHPGALSLIRRFANGVSNYPSAEDGHLAVDQLAAWLEAGKPIS